MRKFIHSATITSAKLSGNVTTRVFAALPKGEPYLVRVDKV
jgi:hypothetical protein